MRTVTRDVTIALPIADRHRAMEFYRDAFGLEPFGEPAADGIPEPLQFRLDEHSLLMLVPTDGLGWVLGERPLAPPNTSECVFGFTLTDEAEVDELCRQVSDAGGTVLAAAQQQDWGYTALCADPDGHVWMLVAAPAAG